MTADSLDELNALLEYMVHHNESHADELFQIAGKLSDLGEIESAKKALAALEEYKKGNSLLNEAISLL